MPYFLIWLIAYLVPAGTALAIMLFLIRKNDAKYNAIVIHAALVISIIISQYSAYSYGLSFPWKASPFSILAIAISIILSILIIGVTGLWYFASSLVQEVAMLSIAFLLLLSFPTYIVILLIVPPFIATHFISLEKWKSRLFVLLIWGVLSIILFSLTQNMYLNIALHTALGSLLISKSVFLVDKKGKYLAKT